MLTIQQEEELIKALSSMTPIEYGLFMDKVRDARQVWAPTYYYPPAHQRPYKKRSYKKKAKSKN